MSMSKREQITLNKRKRAADMLKHCKTPHGIEAMTKALAASPNTIKVQADHLCAIGVLDKIKGKNPEGRPMFFYQTIREELTEKDYEFLSNLSAKFYFVQAKLYKYKDEKFINENVAFDDKPYLKKYSMDDEKLDEKRRLTARIAREERGSSSVYIGCSFELI